MIIVTVSVTIITRSFLGPLVMITTMVLTSCLSDSGAPELPFRAPERLFSGDMA